MIEELPTQTDFLSGRNALLGVNREKSFRSFCVLLC